MRTVVCLLLFAAPVLASNSPLAAEHYRTARAWMQEAKTSGNAVRLAYLGWMIGEELEEAVRLDPNLMDARLDLVRYYVVAPRVVGGSLKKARAEAARIGKRDAALGAWAAGYIAYRQKEYGPARHKLQQAVREAKDARTKALALTWLGYLSQETQQYDDAFAAWASLLATDASRVDALYEVGRTAIFANRELDCGEQALRQYLQSRPGPEMPTVADGHAQLGLLLERRGDVPAARKELETALRLDPKVKFAADALDRLHAH
jgi:tetratricopeptide (TPR) repeat protein